MTTQMMETARDTRTIQLADGDGWLTVCDRELLTPGRGVAALLPDGRQVALFVDRAGRAYAIDNRDPFTGRTSSPGAWSARPADGRSWRRRC